MRFGVRLVAGQVDLRRPAEGALPLQHVLRDVDEHRTRTAGRRDVERLGDRPRDVVAVADQEVVLGDRHGDAGDVGFLEGVGADQPTADLTGDGHYRDRVHVGIGQRRDQVGGAWARRRHAHADFAGGVRISTGRMARALLVADQHVSQLLRVEKRVVDRQHGTAGDAEDDVDVEFLQRPDHGLCTSELVRRNTFRLRGAGLRCCFGGGGRGVSSIGRSRRLLRWSRGGCAHDVLFISVVVSRISNRCWGKKKPPSAGPLYEGRALMLVAMPGRGQARHQRASQLLRAIPGSA